MESLQPAALTPAGPTEVTNLAQESEGINGIYGSYSRWITVEALAWEALRKRQILGTSTSKRTDLIARYNFFVAVLGSDGPLTLGTVPDGC